MINESRFMETEVLIDMHDAVRRLKDGDGETGNDYVMDCRCRRSPDRCSIDSRQSQNLGQPASPTYWRDVIKHGGDRDKMATDCSRRSCESRNSDVSMTSLPESLTSDNDALDSPTSRQAEVEMSPPKHASTKFLPTSGNSAWSRDSTVGPPGPTVGFYISDILRPDFGRTQRPADPDRCQKEAESPERRCPSSYPLSPISLLPATLRRSLVHPYTAAAAFCAAAVAAVQGASSCGPVDSSAVQRQQLMRHHVTNTAAARRMTSSSRDVINVNNNNNNNNNNTKLRSRYVSENRDNSLARPKTSSAVRSHLQQTSPPCNLRTNTSTTSISRPVQSVLASPTASQTSSSRASTGDVVDAKPAAGDDGSLAPLQWPAWVYCTRYSDRPSSGRQRPRTRKPKKKDQIADEKRPRTAFSAAQLDRLKREFDDSKYLTEERRQSLANELQLNESQIKIWFQNKRAKMKKASGVRNQLALQLMAQGLYNHSSVVQR